MGCSSELEGVNEDDHQARYAHCGLETAKRPQLEHHPESKPLRDRVFDGLELLVCSFLGHAHKCRVEGATHGNVGHAIKPDWNTAPEEGQRTEEEEDVGDPVERDNLGRIANGGR